jgi:hypothetical protein
MGFGPGGGYDPIYCAIRVLRRIERLYHICDAEIT